MIRIALAVLLLASTHSAIAADYAVEETSERPDVAAAIVEHLAAKGHHINGPKRALCDIWFAKDVELAQGFQKSGSINYPFSVGALIGVMVVPRRSELTDFRGHEIEAGTYTLRYCRQPQDGNHVGTSDTLDFLVALPAAEDESPAPIADPKQMMEKSAAVSGTTHPAIFTLLPIDKAPNAGKVAQVEGKDFYALEATVEGKGAQVPVKLVVVGMSEDA